MNILEERGLFWWHDEPIPDNQFAPNSAIGGLLTVEDSGRITLELDGVFQNEKGPWAVLEDQPGVQDKAIQGILKVSADKVLLIGIIGAGGRVSTYGMSYKKYGAVNCLVGDRAIATRLERLTFRTLEIGLEGFEEWLRLRSIVTARSDSGATAKYKQPRNAKYSDKEGKLLLKYKLNGDQIGKLFGAAVSWKETASIEYSPKVNKTLEELKKLHQQFEELLILLTDSDYPLDWPFVWSSEGNRYRCYFLRIKNSEAVTAPASYECCTNFPIIRGNFGIIWRNWRKRREEVGAGVYLYVGTRRAPRLYVEHRFVNLIFGIEAFHRQLYPTSKSKSLEAKIKRIVDRIESKNDRKWLKRKLAYANEPSLEDRIFDVFKNLTIELDPPRLRSFCRSCADLRNEVSHFGGPKPGKPYTAFMTALNNSSNALAILYHVLLLQEIGVDDAIVKSWIDKGYRSFRIKWIFVQAGLLADSTLKS